MAAEALGFQMNSAAQTLRRRRSKTIGLCTTHMTTSYLRELAISLDAIAARNGYELIQVQSHQNPRTELARVTSLLGRQVDGLILLPSLQPQPSLDAISSAGVPNVVIDRQPEDTRFNSVIVDNYSAMKDIVAALSEAKRRNVLFVAQNLEVATTRHRIAGLKAASSEYGLSEYHVMELGSESDFHLRLAARFNSSNVPDAIIMGNSRVALSTINALRNLSLSWPAAVSIVTFDDPDWAEVVEPGLSTVQVPLTEMSAIVWELLSKQMEGDPGPPKSLMVRGKLIRRGSL